MISPFSILILSVLLSRLHLFSLGPPKISFATPLLSITGLFLAVYAIFWADLALVDVLVSTEAVSAVAILLFLLILGFASRHYYPVSKGFDRSRESIFRAPDLFKGDKVSGVPFYVLTAFSVVFTISLLSGRLMRIVVRTGDAYDTYHAPFAWADLLAPFTGAYPFSSYIPQYSSSLGYFLEPYFLVLGASDESLSVLMLIFALVILWSLIYILRTFWPAPMAIALGGVILSFGILPGKDIGGYFQIFPIRYLLPILLVVAFIHAVERKTRVSHLILGVVLSIGALNNFEWGLTSSVITLVAFGLVSWIRENNISRVWLVSRWVMLGFVGTSLIFFAGVWLRSGVAPDPFMLTEFALALGGTDNMVRAPWFGLLQIFLVSFVLAAAYAAYWLLKGSRGKPSSSDAGLLLIGVIGLALAIYPFGRSLPVVNFSLFLWWGLVLFAFLGILVGRFSTLSGQGSSRKIESLALTSPLILVAIVVTLTSATIYSPATEIERLRSEEGPNYPMTSEIDKFLVHLGNEEATTFALHSGKQIAGRAGQNDSFPFNSSVSMGISRGQLTSFVESMYTDRTRRAVIWAPCCTPNVITDTLLASGFEHFAFSDAVGNGSGPLVLRRLAPMGTMIGSSQNGSFKVVFEVLPKTISISRPEDYVLSARMQVFDAHKEVLFSDASYELPGLFLPNAIAISNSGDVVVGGARYVLNEFTQSFGWDSALLGFDKNGQRVWNRWFTEQGPDSVTTLDINSEGLILAGGGSFGDVVDGVSGVHSTLLDSFLILLDASGEVRDSVTANVGGNDRAVSVNWLDNESFLVVTSSDQTSDSLLYWSGATSGTIGAAFHNARNIGTCEGIQALEDQPLVLESGLKVQFTCTSSGKVSQVSLDLK